MADWQESRVIDKKVWNDELFSLTFDTELLPFKAGQFIKVGLEVDGERIEEVEPVIGYMHRGYEKLAEVRTYPQVTTLINRIDWISGFANEVAFIRAIENLMGIEPTPRAQMIRLILTELTRISNHLIFASSYPLELGAATPLMYAMREREHIMDVIESVTGGRFHPNFNRVGGVKPAAGGGKTQKKVTLDLPAGFYAAVENAMDRAEYSCQEFEELVTGNEMIQVRTKGVGVLSYEDAIGFGVSGPNARASGVDAHGDVGRLLVDRHDHTAGVAVEAVDRIVVADAVDRLTGDLGDVDVRRGRDLTGDHTQAGRQQGLTGHPAVGVLGQDGVDLLLHLGAPLRHQLALGGHLLGGRQLRGLGSAQ